MTQRMPVLFVGHGSPMNAIVDTSWSDSWGKIAETIREPKAILCISAHWLTKGTFVHNKKDPKIIYDFYGFPKALYDFSYPVIGSPEYAETTKKQITQTKVQDDETWGIDHGTWIVLSRMYPHANIPVFQLSIDISKPASFHYEIGKELSALREKGILIIGSGNIVHNLGIIKPDPKASAFDWALEFDDISKNFLQSGDDQSLIQYEKLGESARLSIPTPDHYFPLLYTLGARSKNETPHFFADGIAHGSISMRAISWG